MAVHAEVADKELRPARLLDPVVEEIEAWGRSRWHGDGNVGRRRAPSRDRERAGRGESGPALRAGEGVVHGCVQGVVVGGEQLELPEAAGGRHRVVGDAERESGRGWRRRTAGAGGIAASEMTER